ncbi:AcrR family transcriptional regulator [Leucobacter exalbidus]|uniref:AcrR family transcriptional regulator n=1 Tax=Leucobacter exalbidus TaxID=662960 RepID=A0A940T3D9_9MICO|nr:TetR family transcriptional regulator [Leucobacter exalbidus]MBP1326057.1 AcrR family transcriptional regulator [Leucobacter exalbidus]
MNIGSDRAAVKTGETGTPHPPEQARSIERRAQLLAAALRLLLASGSAGVTHRGVAEESDSSPGAVRYYFRSREDLLIACIEEIERARDIEAAQVLDHLAGAAPKLTGPEPTAPKPTTPAPLAPEPAARAALKIYYGADLDDAAVTGTLWGIMDCARESPTLATLTRTHRHAAQQQLAHLLTRTGYSHVAVSLVTAVLDGNLLTTTIERQTAGAEAAVAELTILLRQMSRD